MSSQTFSSSTLAPVTGALAPATGPSRLPAIPWRDPHSVSPQKLAEVIASLKEACALDPHNAEVRVCLGMAYAMNYDPYRSMDILEEARALEPGNFLAQFKYAELHFRLRTLARAEEETRRALELASNHWELGQARHQLSEIRRMLREGTMKPVWSKSVVIPVICLGLIMAVITVLFRVIR
jgi:tetratricopeptide (TPR) repeat protein